MKQDNRTIRAYCGNLYQVCGTRHYRLSDGRTDGCRCIDVRTGSGLDFTVVPDRAMDLSLASYKGTNLVFLTPCAEAHPSYYNAIGDEWLRTFTAGLLTTLGPTYLGPSCVDNGEPLGLHGRMSTLPVKTVADLSDPAQGKIELRGTMQDAFTFGHKLQIDRVIRAASDAPVLELEDTVTNFGGRDVPLCMLYHINFGYPLLDENAQLLVPKERCIAADETSAACDPAVFRAPDGRNAERNYAYTFDPSVTCQTVGIWTPTVDGGLGVYIRFDPHQLPHMNQWALEDVADYIAALEPATCPCESRTTLRDRKLLPILPAGQTRTLRVQIGIIRTEAEKNRLFTEQAQFHAF